MSQQLKRMNAPFEGDIVDLAPFEFKLVSVLGAVQPVVFYRASEIIVCVCLLVMAVVCVFILLLALFHSSGEYSSVSGYYSAALAIEHRNEKFLLHSIQPFMMFMLNLTHMFLIPVHFCVERCWGPALCFVLWRPHGPAESSTESQTVGVWP